MGFHWLGFPAAFSESPSRVFAVAGRLGHHDGQAGALPSRVRRGRATGQGVWSGDRDLHQAAVDRERMGNSMVCQSSGECSAISMEDRTRCESVPDAATLSQRLQSVPGLSHIHVFARQKRTEEIARNKLANGSV